MTNVSYFVKIISIPDEKLFSETYIGALLHTFSKLYDVLVGFVNPPSFEAVYCNICDRRSVDVVRYRMICLVVTPLEYGFDSLSVLVIFMF